MKGYTFSRCQPPPIRCRTRNLILAYMNALVAGDTNVTVAE